jgi:hypothetical protein
LKWRRELASANHDGRVDSFNGLRPAILQLQVMPLLVCCAVFIFRRCQHQTQTIPSNGPPHVNSDALAGVESAAACFGSDSVGILADTTCKNLTCAHCLQVGLRPRKCLARNAPVRLSKNVIIKRDFQINRAFAMTISASIVVLVGFGCSRHPNKAAAAIAEHRQKYIALAQEYETNLPAILKDEPRRYALVQAQLRELDALVSLGYLAETNIPLKAEWSRDLSQALWQASLSDREVASFSLPIRTNGLNVTRVRARPSDVQIWKRIIEENGTR